MSPECGGLCEPSRRELGGRRVNVGGDASDARNNTPLIRDERDKRRPNAVNPGTNFPRHGTIDDYLSRLVTTQAATSRVCSFRATLATGTSQAAENKMGRSLIRNRPEMPARPAVTRSGNQERRVRSLRRSSRRENGVFFCTSHPQVTHPGVVQDLAATVVDLQLAGAEDLQRLLERLLRVAAPSRAPCPAACSSAACRASSAAGFAATGSGRARGCGIAGDHGPRHRTA